MAFDYKKEYKELYAPKTTAEIIDVPSMNFLAVRGSGDPNDKNGLYQQAIELLYGIAYTLKMSHKSDYKIEGFFQYVVPPLEGLWWMEDVKGVDYTKKDKFNWISLIRLPDFVKEKDYIWACEQAAVKKKKDFSKVEYFTYSEGLCVQCMHIGPFDDEPATVENMVNFAKSNSYAMDYSDIRRHHEIYLSDFRRSKPENLKTVIRLPIKAE